MSTNPRHNVSCTEQRASSNSAYFDFEAQSQIIVGSKEMWAQFQAEARAGGVSTAAGLREMLKQKHAEETQRRSSLEPHTNNLVSKKLSSDSNRNYSRRSSWGSKGEVDLPFDLSQGTKTVDKPERPTLTSTGTSYRNVIRGKAGPVLSYAKGSGHIEDRRNTLTLLREKFIGSSQEYGHNGEDDDDDSTIVPVSIPLIVGSGRMTTVAAESDTDSVEDYYDYTIDDICSDDISDGDTDVSDDDRSNNGRFEYPRESRKIALVRSLPRRRRTAKFNWQPSLDSSGTSLLVEWESSDN